MVRSRRPDALAARLEARRCAPLLPAVAEAAARVEAPAVGLVGLGPAGLEAHLDRVGVTYERRDRSGDGRAPTLGDAASAVRTTCVVVGPGRVPERASPDVVTRLRLDPDPLDVTDAATSDGLGAAHADAVALLRAEPAALVRADLVDGLPAALGQVPDGVLPVVVTAWALSELPGPGRQRFLDRLAEVARERAVAWVSVEGVGVAPEVPTFGDRPASGHSIIGITVLERSSRRTEAVGRCWSRGGLLSWLA